MKKTILCVVGTRPEAIKMAPVILALRQQPWARVRVLATAQHRQMLDQVLSFFGIAPDIDLDLMRPGQTLAGLTSRLMEALDSVLADERPDIVLAQGDTTTVMVAALASFYRRIPFGHVEAGLRTHDIDNPFPEEANRLIAARLARWHFAPTERSRDNLLHEGIRPETVHVTGNTVIDALLETASRDLPLTVPLSPDRRLVLITAHRRENFGEPFREICRAIKTLSQQYPGVQFVYPVHPNPNVREVAYECLGQQSGVTLCEPFDYAPFVTLMKRACLVISDSGGVQEEAPALGVPVLVLRDETERPEAVEMGVVALVGPHHDRIVAAASRLLSDETARQAMARGVSPYGDGQAAARIVTILQRFHPSGPADEAP